MESIKNITEARKAGTAMGAAAEMAIGETLTGRVLDVLRTLPKGKAVKLVEAFWESFDKAAPTIRGLRRIKVTRSESVRIARGIDVGIAPGDSWAAAVKAAPKAQAGKGAGGGRKPRPAGTSAKPAETAKPETAKPEVPLAPITAVRQSVAQLVALCHQHTSKLPAAFTMAVDDLAELAKDTLKS